MARPFTIGITTALVLTITMAAPPGADACSFSPPELGWQITDHPTNAPIRFTFNHFEEPFEVTLTGPDGEAVDANIRTLADRASYAGSWVIVEPIDALEPLATYTISARFFEGSRWGTDPIGTIEVVTADGPLTLTPPEVSNVRFAVRDSVFGDDCDAHLTSELYYVAFDHSEAEHPFLYHVELSFPDETGSQNPWTPSWYAISHNPEIATATSGIMIPHSLNARAFPCVTVHVEDIIGQTATSETVCQPVACFDKTTRSVPIEAEQWLEEPSSCDALIEVLANRPTIDGAFPNDTPGTEREDSPEDDNANTRGCTQAPTNTTRSKSQEGPSTVALTLLAIVCLRNRRRR